MGTRIMGKHNMINDLRAHGACWGGGVDQVKKLGKYFLVSVRALLVY